MIWELSERLYIGKGSLDHDLSLASWQETGVRIPDSDIFQDIVENQYFGPYSGTLAPMESGRGANDSCK